MMIHIDIGVTVAEEKHKYAYFIEKIRSIIAFYLSLEYVGHQVGGGAKKNKKKPQDKIRFNSD